MQEFTESTGRFDKAATVIYPTDANYGTTTDPTFTVQELLVFQIPSDKTVDITLASGDTVTGIEPRGASMVLDTISIESVTVNDPAASGGDTSIMVIGD